MIKEKKVSEASIRVLETLKLLHINKVGIQDIIENFGNLGVENRVYTNEVILKYINTLKVFGLKIIKEKDKYLLLESPHKFDLNKNELKAFYKLLSLADVIPEKKIKEDIKEFANNAEKYFSKNTRLLSKEYSNTKIKEISFDYSKYASKINLYEKYCHEGQRLKILYKNHKKCELSILVEPIEIKYIGNEVYFSVYNPISAQVQDINFNSISIIEQLPSKTIQTIISLSSVTFKLSNTLAKSYRLKQGEELLNNNPDGSIVIINKKEDKILLLRRLMRYGENCEVLSPKSVRTEIKDMIKATIKAYSENI